MRNKMIDKIRFFGAVVVELFSITTPQRIIPHRIVD